MSVSSRMLRKFRGDQDALKKAAEDASDVDDSLFSPAPRANTNINRYNLLNDETQSESEVKEDDGEAENVNKRQPSTDTRISKRKKKKKKRQSLPASQKHSSEDLDEVERSVKEVNAILGDEIIFKSQTKTSNDSNKNLLAIERKHLNPKNELKRIFGSKTIQASEGPNRKTRNRSHANLWLVTFREHWALHPRSGPGLSMIPLEKKDGCHYFKYEHSPSYQTAERRFMSCVEALDPDQLVALSNAYPLHVNTLLQLADMCKMSEEISVAAQMTERALFSLECGFHPLFQLGKGTCRLEYKYQENRALYITLFNHLIFVGQRACYRTALEFCKLLLSLDPIDDPLAIVLAIDFYAIRAGEHSWLLQFIDEANDSRHLNQLPNMALSAAVANYHLGETEQADSLLQDALLMFPGVLIPLLEQCSIQPDSKTIGCSYFQDAQITQSKSLKLLLNLYIARNYHIWKDPQMLRWLERNTVVVLERIANKDPVIEDYALKRKARFDCAPPRAVQRHVLLSDIKEVAVGEIGTTFNFDPLPPFDSVNIYVRPERPGMYENFNTFSLFFRSLMPFFNEEGNVVGEVEVIDRVARANEAAGGGAERGALQRSVSRLLDAMRNLMTNMQQPGNYEYTDGSASEEEEENN